VAGSLKGGELAAGETISRLRRTKVGSSQEGGLAPFREREVLCSVHPAVRAGLMGRKMQKGGLHEESRAKSRIRLSGGRRSLRRKLLSAKKKKGVNNEFF